MLRIGRLKTGGRWLWVCHLTAWGLVAIYSLFLFVGNWFTHPALILSGAGLCGVMAITILVGEILLGKSPTLNDIHTTGGMFQ